MKILQKKYSEEKVCIKKLYDCIHIKKPNIL